MGVGLDGEVNCFQVLSNTHSGEVIAWTLAAPNGVELQGWVGVRAVLLCYAALLLLLVGVDSEVTSGSAE